MFKYNKCAMNSLGTDFGNRIYYLRCEHHVGTFIPCREDRFSLQLLPSRPLEFRSSERQFLFFLVTLVSIDIPPCACLSLKKILSARNATTYFGRCTSHAISACREAICITERYFHGITFRGNHARF